MQPIRRSETGGHTIYMDVSVWYNHETGHIHIAVPGTDWFHSTVNAVPGSKRCHADLFGKLTRALKEAGAPHPDVPPDADEDEPRLL